VCSHDDVVWELDELCAPLRSDLTNVVYMSRDSSYVNLSVGRAGFDIQ
jgi:hypothetical protein